MITRQGRVEVLNDPECRLFPWHPRPVLELSESNAVQLHEGPCLVLFVGELEPLEKLLSIVFKFRIARCHFGGFLNPEAPCWHKKSGNDICCDSFQTETKSLECLLIQF